MSSLDVRWIHGSPDGDPAAEPPLQVYAFDKDTYILRQSKCQNFEAPFLYLLFGRERAILLDTGASGAGGRPLPVRAFVEGIVAQWKALHQPASFELVVAHTHGHEDHVAGDSQFAGRPETRLVPVGVNAVCRFFGFSSWPDGTATFDLGNRELTLLAVPGHLDDHIAVYDARAQILLNGDVFYPGFLFVNDPPAFRKSIARLADFVAKHPVRFLLGSHIEMSRSPGLDYAYGTTYQPFEHVLELVPHQLQELHAATETMGDRLTRKVFDDFILQV
jgi:glyoxylase-like metal-dependent hydrolase (beta-lactamase superfamily II)